MLKTRIIPVLTFNGFALVKTKQFSNPRMVGNPVQAARVYNSRGVDELIFIDIYASKQNRKINLRLVKEILKECFMPVGIGGGINTLDDINDLLQIGADKVVVKNIALIKPDFINSAANFFGSQCISVEKTMTEYIQIVQDLGAGEIILNSVDNDGMMNGFDYQLFNKANEVSHIPIVYVGGGGNLEHYKNLFENTDCKAIASGSIFHFTQYTPLDIKNTLNGLGKPVRI